MARDELVRAVAALPVSVLLGVSIPALRGRAWRGILAGLLVALALSNHLSAWKTWVVVAVAVGASAAMPSSPVLAPGSRASEGPRLYRRQGLWAIAIAIAATVAAILLTDPSGAKEAVVSTSHSTSLVLVAAGGLLAVFVGGELIARVLHPFAEKLVKPEATSMERAGRVIGWLERALLYSLVLAGAPDAAALVVAGKSIARFPAFSREAFAEYYLIGSLLSLLVAAAAGIAVRAALGESPLPSALA